MNIFLKFLISALRTIDGNRGTAETALKQIYRSNRENEGKKVKRFKKLDEDEQLKLWENY